MTGPDYDDDGPERFRPAPHPDDRLWRHPSEMAAMQAAHANAETVQIPAVTVPESRSRLQTGLLVAAGVVVIGAAALTLGIMSNQTRNSSQIALDASDVQRVDRVADNGSIAPLAAPETSGETSAIVYDGDEERLVSSLHNEIATSLPRVQAATPSGMREGSGLFVTDEGHVATSAGLISNADYVLVWTEDGQRWKAHLIASDPVSDIAVIQIDSGDWPSVALGTGTELWSGQPALMLDHDLGEIVFGEVVSIEGALVGLEMPTALPGSAVVDNSGAVIAMVNNDDVNTHATPAWMIEQVAVDLISSGATTHIWLGVLLEPGTETQVDEVLIGEIVPESPAHLAGLLKGDVIDSVNGEPVEDSATLHRLIEAHEPGDEAVLTVTRDGSQRIIIAVLAALPE